MGGDAAAPVAAQGFSFAAKVGVAVAVAAAGGCAVVAVRYAARVGRSRGRLRELIAAAAGEDARVVVTGATSGIGLELARALQQHPAVRLLVGCRDARQADALFADMDRVRVVPLDLLDLDSVQAFADEVHEFMAEPAAGAASGGLRLLVNNAGVMRAPAAIGSSKNGAIDATWQTNFLAPFLLTELLARRRAATARSGGAPLRVVNVSSRLEARSLMDDDSLEAARGKGEPGAAAGTAYSDSKRAMMLWTSVRAQALAFSCGVFVHCATPGMVDTQLGRHSVAPWLWPLTKPLRAALLRSPAEGALAVAAAGLTPRSVGTFGRYMDGERQLEDLVIDRIGDKTQASKVVKWATEVSALEQRVAGYDR